MENHIESHFGPYESVFHELVSPDIHVDIARVVGADTRNDGYCSGNGYMVTWALGHLSLIHI